MKKDIWRKARAFLWLAVTVVFLVFILLLSGAISIPGIASSPVSLAGYGIWIFAILILLATKALLDLMRPVFRAALRTHVRYEADIFAHFKNVGYVVWATALVLVAYILAGTGIQQNLALSLGLVGAALVYVLGEPLLCLVGWVVLVTQRIYNLGDRIEVNNTRGYVVGISPLSTTVREFGGMLSTDTHTGRYVTIPNSQVVRGHVFNATKDTPFVWDQITVTAPLDVDAKVVEGILLESAEDVVGSMMRTNREHLRSKYEFADLQEYVAEEPTVQWGVRDAGVDLTLIYFCPVFERPTYRTRLVKAILAKVADHPEVRLVGAATGAAAPVPVLR